MNFRMDTELRHRVYTRDELGGLHATLVRRADGRIGVHNTLSGDCLGVMVDADDRRFEPDDGMGGIRSIIAALCFVVGFGLFALLLWNAGRCYERQYGADIHASRWSR